MNRATFANISLILVALGWLILAYAILSNLGDVGPSVTSEQIRDMRNQAFSIAFVGVAFLFCSGVFAGHSITVARYRSIMALACFALPFIGVLIFGFLQPL